MGQNRMGHNKMLKRRRLKKLGKKRLATAAKRAKKVGNQKARQASQAA